MTLLSRLHTLITRLQTHRPSADHAFIGFDGYLDKIQKVVQAKSPAGNQYFERIDGLAILLHTLAGRSGQIELVTLETKIGGNAPIMAQAMAALGVPNWCAGTLSHPVFETMHPACTRISLGPPAETNALEFGDGKLIFSEVSVFEKLQWPVLVKEIGLETLKEQYDQCRLLAFVDWANLPYGNALWQGYLEDVVMPGGPTGKHFFFDLCDPTKRSAADIQEALALAARYIPYGDVTLGMNENEARRIFLALNGQSPADADRLAQTPELSHIARFIQAETSIPTVLIHPTDNSLAATPDGTLILSGRLVPVPKVLTGGGDNLNAGFCWAKLQGFDLPDCLLLGMASSGAYIENGYSPDLPDLIAYLKNWAGELERVGVGADISSAD